MDLNIDYLEVRFNTRQRDNFIYTHESNFWRVLSLSKKVFACFKGISLANLDQLYTSSVYEFWLPDEDQYHVVIEPIVIAPYLALEFLDADPIWGNVVGNDIVLGFPINSIPVENGNISRNTG